MNPKVFKMVLFLAVVLLMCMFNSCAENEPAAPEASPIPITTVITAGPADNEVLSFNSTATFTWDGDIRPGVITGFSYYFIDTDNMDTLFHNSALERLYSASGLATGNYSFKVYAHGEEGDSVYVDQQGDSRTFSVGVPDAEAPVVQIIAGPKQDSYAATGANMFIEWTATDPSPAGAIVSYSFALADSSMPDSELVWSEPRLETTQAAYYNLENKTYRFYAKATDIGGSSSIATTDFVVKTPDILFAIEPAYSSGDVKFWHENVLKDFAYEDYYVSDKADFIAKLQSGQYSTVIWAWKNGYSTLIDSTEFADVTAPGTVAEAVYNYTQGANQHLWVVASEIMWGFDALGIDITGPNTFNNMVLHTASYDEAPGNFQGCTATGVGAYNDMIVDGQATFTWCDQTDPTADAAAIYNFSTGDFAGQPCGVRYPASAPNPGDAKVVFFGFYMTDTYQPAAMKASDVYAMATTLLTEFGENED